MVRLLVNLAALGGALLSSSHRASQIVPSTPRLFFRGRDNFSMAGRCKPLTLSGCFRESVDSVASEPTSSSSVSAPLNEEESNGIAFVGQENVPLEGVIQFEKPNSASFLDKWGPVALLAGGDVSALLLCSAIGMFSSHGISVFERATLQTADPFIAGWLLSAYLVGGYGDDGQGKNGFRPGVAAAVKSWCLGIPLGMMIRGLSERHIPANNFILVTLGSTGMLLIGWRALLMNVLAGNKSKKNDLYKRGSPFELLELLTSLVRRW